MTGVIRKHGFKITGSVTERLRTPSAISKEIISVRTSKGFIVYQAHTHSYLQDFVSLEGQKKASKFSIIIIIRRWVWVSLAHT